MSEIERDIEREINIIIDRYERLDISYRDIRRYLLGRNILKVLDDLEELEYKYLQDKDKTDKDFKKLVKNKISLTLKDREYHKKDLKESMVLKTYENFEPEMEWEEDYGKIVRSEDLIKGNYYILIYKTPDELNSKILIKYKRQNRKYIFPITYAVFSQYRNNIEDFGIDTDIVFIKPNNESSTKLVIRIPTYREQKFVDELELKFNYMKNLKIRTYENFEPEEEWEEEYNEYETIDKSMKNQIIMGTKVKILDSSKYRDQGVDMNGGKMIGIIISLSPIKNFDFYVRWENRRGFSYNYDDLEYLIDYGTVKLESFNPEEEWEEEPNLSIHELIHDNIYTNEFSDGKIVFVFDKVISKDTVRAKKILLYRGNENPVLFNINNISYLHNLRESTEKEKEELFDSYITND